MGYMERISTPGPKKLLALDGGGIRGVLSIRRSENTTTSNMQGYQPVPYCSLLQRFSTCLTCIDAVACRI